jgi:GTPase
MSFKVAILGRPNVGKSTLFNRLVGKKLALVDDTPGVTRDRRVHPAKLYDLHFDVIDTAGFETAAAATLQGRMRAQTEIAIREADLIFFMVDSKSGLMPDDKAFADIVRRSGKPVVLVANKAEARGAQGGMLEAWEVGLGEPIPISAEHGQGMPDLRDAVIAALGEERAFGEEDAAEEFAESEALIGEDIADPDAEDIPAYDETKPMRIAVVGRPNAGKSTLLNRLLGEERMLTGPEPGLTRDAVAVTLTDAEGRRVELVDTAGLRRRARVEAPLEKMSVGAAIGALKMAEVVLLAVDGVEGLHDQDLQIAQLIEREGRAIVLALTKWDAVPDRDAARRAVADRLETSLAQLRGIPVVTLSALTGAGIDRLWPAVWGAYETWNRRVPTGELNRWFEGALERHPPPLVDRRRLKLRYITQAKARPPTFVVFGTRAERIPDDYARYLVNGLREECDLPGVPIRLQLRGTKNPFADP